MGDQKIRNEQEMFARLGENTESIKNENFSELREILTEKLSMTDDELFERFKIRKHEMIDLIAGVFSGGYQNYNPQKRYQCHLDLTNLLLRRGVLAMEIPLVTGPFREVIDEFERRLRIKETN